MSMQAGVWNFDGRPPDERWLETMSRELAQHGPDGEQVYRAPGLAMLYRPFHTTAESRLERQPYQSPRGAVMTWDGRLDNRAELITELERDLRDDRTDVAIAAAAYDRWGEQAFVKLVGDFALVIWDGAKRRLFLAKDFAGPKHLYYVLTSSSVLWSSRLDTLVLHGGGTWTLDEEWLGSYLMYRPSAYCTPYAQIRTIGPATFSKIEHGLESVRRYWTWEPRRKIRYRVDAEYEEHFRFLFRQSVKRRLRTDAPVLAELSGGVDSSCIVCMADRIAADGEAETPRIDTVTHCRPDDRNGSLPFVHILETRRGRAGGRIVVDCDEPLSFFRHSDGTFYPFPGLSTTGCDLESRRFAVVLLNGNRVVLSGIGGDEVLGGIPYPLGQLGDALVQRRWREFIVLLRSWSQVKQIPIWHLAAHTTMKLLPRGWQSCSDEPEAWLATEFARRGALRRPYPTSVPPVGDQSLPSQKSFVEAFESERQLLTLHTPPLVGVNEKRYPYMDRDLLDFLLSIPNTQLLRPGERRSLLRRAMRTLVPDPVLWRKSKAAGAWSLGPIVGGCLDQIVETFDAVGYLADRYFDRGALKSALCDAVLGRSRSPMRLIRAIAVLAWMKDLHSRRLTAETRRHAPTYHMWRYPSMEGR